MSHRFRQKGEKDEEWIKALGANTGDRTNNLGADVIQFRKNVGLPQSVGEKQELFNKYMHDIGSTLLRSKVDEDAEEKEAQDRLKRKQKQLATLLKKKVKVTDFDDGGLSIAIDREWDTSTWGDELVIAGVDALLLLFQIDDGSSKARKDRALYMLEKLLTRHTEAENHVRKKLEILIGKGTSSLIWRGRSKANLDLIPFLNGLKERYCREMLEGNRS